MTHITTWENQGVYWDIFDNLNSDEVIEFNEELSDNSRLSTIKYFIWDSTNVTKISIDKDDASLASVFSKLLNQYNGNIKGAFVVTDMNLKALVQEYINSSKEIDATWEFIIFEDIKSAREWVST